MNLNRRYHSVKFIFKIKLGQVYSVGVGLQQEGGGQAAPGPGQEIHLPLLTEESHTSTLYPGRFFFKLKASLHFISWKT
jgi:hypothetical protein